MIKSSKIPFAIDLADGQMVEVGDVPAGKLCNCICPSCDQGVIAKQGEINQWHFAHDKHSDRAPTRMCEISFFSCCRRYLVEQALAVRPGQILLPDYEIKEFLDKKSKLSKVDSSIKAKTVEIDKIEKGIESDLTLTIKGHRLHIVLTYPGKLPPRPPHKEALLEIQLSYFQTEYSQRKTEPGLFNKLVTDVFNNPDALESKKWVFHPKEIKIREQLREGIEKMWIDDAVRWLNVNKSNKEPINTTISREICACCKHEWPKLPGSKRVCPKCKLAY